MSRELFYGVKGWVIFGGLFVLILSTTEIGFQLGRRAQPSTDTPTLSNRRHREAERVPARL